MKGGVGEEEGRDLPDDDTSAENSLFYALKDNRLEQFNEFLPMVTNPNATKDGGNGFLHFVMIHWKDDGSVASIINALLDKGANLNIQNNNGNTPLHLLASKKNNELVNNLAQILFKKGADPNIENKKGQTPLYIAKSKGFTEFVDEYELFLSNQNEVHNPMHSPMRRGGKHNKKRNRTIKRKKNQ